MSERVDYERVGRFIYAFHRTGLTPEQLRGTVTPGAAGPAQALRERAANLADRFDELVAKGEWERASDEQLQAVLEEAQQLSAELSGRGDTA